MDTENKMSGLLEAILIAAVPIIAYVMNFAYESGYATILGIPPTFISLNFIDVLNNIIPISCSFVCAVFALYLSQFIIPCKKSCSKCLWAKPILILLIFAVIVIISRFPLFQMFQNNFHYDVFKAKTIKQWIISILLIAYFLAIFFKWRDIYKNFTINKTATYLCLILTMVAMYLMSYFQGRTTAKYQVNYTILNKVTFENGSSKKIKRVVLKNYADMFVCSDIKQEINGTCDSIDNYVIVKLTDTLILSQDIVGPLCRKQGISVIKQSDSIKVIK